jgi:hypothetical protein
MQVILAIATILGGITALWFLFEKLLPWWRSRHTSKLTTLKDLLKILEAKRTANEPFSVVELLDSLGFSRMEVELLRDISKHPDVGIIFAPNSGNYLKDREFEVAKEKLIRRGFLVEDSDRKLRFAHKSLKEYAEFI